MINLPRTSLSIVGSPQIAALGNQRVLLVGQMLAGSATAGVLYPDFPSDGEEDAFFDATSHMAGIIRAFKAENLYTAVDILPLDDAGTAVAGTSVITLASGPATADAVIYVTIGSAKTHRKKVTITSGDAITDIGDAIVAAFASDTKKPFTPVNVAGVVTSTATNKGTLSNEWGMEIEGVIPGVTIAHTAWTGGTTDPVLTSVLDAIGNTRYQTILWPSNYDISVVQTLLDARFNKANAIEDGVAVQVKTDTLSNLKSYVSAFNSQSVVVPVQEKISETVYSGQSTMEFPDVTAAQICAIRALRLTEGAPLTQFLTTVAPSDQFGGIGIASLPYFNTALPNQPIANPVHQFSDIEIQELTNAGLSTFGPNQAFNGTIFGEFVTTYLTDTAGNPDDSFKFLNTIDVSSTIREYYFNNLKSRFAQSRLTDGDLVPGRDIANESLIRAFCNKLFGILGDEAITQKGSAAVKDYDDNLDLVLDIQTGTATLDQAPLLVGQLRIIIGTIQINFGG